MRGYADELSKSARGVHAQIVARDQDAVAGREIDDRTFDHFARRIDARRMRKGAGHAAMPGRRERVFVIERGIPHPNQDLALGQRLNPPFFYRPRKPTL